MLELLKAFLGFGAADHGDPPGSHAILISLARIALVGVRNLTAATLVSIGLGWIASTLLVMLVSQAHHVPRRVSCDADYARRVPRRRARTQVQCGTGVSVRGNVREEQASTSQARVRVGFATRRHVPQATLPVVVIGDSLGSEMIR